MAEPRRPLLERIGLRGSAPDRDQHGISLTSSARTLDLRDRSEGARMILSATKQKWQDEAWVYRDAIGEVREVNDWLGNTVSRVQLYVGVLVPGVDEPVPVREATEPDDDGNVLVTDLPPALVEDAEYALAQLARAGLGDLLHRAVVNQEITGEWYLVGRLDDLGRERWEVRSSDELVKTEAKRLPDGRMSSTWALRDAPASGTAGSTGLTHLDEDTSYVARVWRSHPRWTGLADSPMRAVLDRCEELLLLGRKIRATSRSRLSAPLLLIASELDLGDGTVDPTTGELVPAVPVEQLLTEAMVTPIGDESAASAVVPIILKGPGAALEHVKTVDLGRKPDKEDAAERAEILRRILQGLDAPPEVALGYSDVKYANAKAIDRQGFRDHVEPKVLSLVHAFTTAYLRVRLATPVDEAGGWSDELLERLVIWYDPSQAVTEPDLSTPAQEVYDAGELSGAALRRYRGFSEDDAPTDDEREAREGEPGGGDGPADTGDGEQEADSTGDGAPASEDPGATAARARATLARTARPALVAGATPGGSAQAPLELGRDLLGLDRELFGRVHAAADSAMTRALERAGARARSKVRGDSGVASIIRDTPNRQVVSTLVALAGRQGHVQHLASYGLAEDDLLAGDPFGEVVDRFTAWSQDTFEAGLRQVAQALGLRYWTREHTDALLTAAGELDVPFREPGGIDFATLRQQADRDRQAAADLLRRDLTRQARERLYDPTPTAPPLGEHDPNLTVPAGTVRAAMARAGGADSAEGSSGVDDYGRPLLEDDGPAGGVATGRSLRDASAIAGLTTYAYRWNHGAARRPFEPHLRLDGQVFESQSDDRLASPDRWLTGTSYYPGDHPGCTCWTEYLYADPFAGLDDSQRRSVRSRQQARDARGRFMGRRDDPEDTPGDGVLPVRRAGS